MGRWIPEDSHLDQAEDDAAISELRTSFKRVHNRVNTLEAELERVNAQLRRRAIKGTR